MLVPYSGTETDQYDPNGVVDGGDDDGDDDDDDDDTSIKFNQIHSIILETKLAD
jgi:hypothetical protein